MTAETRKRPKFWQNTSQRDTANLRRKAVFGAVENGKRLEDPEYLAKLAPPPLPSEAA